jgi:ATP-dependent DNA helicase RecG
MSDYKLSAEGRKRLEIMVQSNDGFEIAEADLKLRGPGDIEGTRQSGLLDFKIANLAKDGELIATTRQLAEHILDKDANLDKPENSRLKHHVQELQKENNQWGRIS